MENNNNNFAILVLVAIVAVIGVVSLVMMMNSGSNSVAMPGVAMTDGSNVAGQGFTVAYAKVSSPNFDVGDLSYSDGHVQLSESDCKALLGPTIHSVTYNSRAGICYYTLADKV